RDFLEKVILMDGGAHQIYNATEGGARIKGTVEKPFAECCAEFLHDKKPYFESPAALGEGRQKELARELYEKIELSRSLCMQWKEKFLRLHSTLQEEFLQCENLELDAALLRLDGLMARAEEARELEFMHESFHEIIQPSFIMWNLNIARVITLNPTSKEDLFNKNAIYIKEHLEFMQMAYGLLDAQEQTLKRAIIPLKTSLENAL
ncbi:MAG: hypothetical protein Q4A73_07240, partial [Campylobacter sp.]|nr:hypothetical protein [Campylobacter sp.]